MDDVVAIDQQFQSVPGPNPSHSRRRFSVESHACPHVDRNDMRCGNRFSLGRIEQAYDVCFGSYLGCPMFHRINSELARLKSDAEGSIDRPPLVAITIHAAGQPLRATGA
jgi:hypothetical protein